MAACAIEVSSMIQNQGRADYATIEGMADARLEEWARWSGRGAAVGPAPPRCTLGRVQSQRVAAGAQGVAPEVPATVDEVERVVLQLSQRERHLISSYYIDYSTMDEKAKDCRMSRSGYWRALQRARRHVYSLLY